MIVRADTDVDLDQFPEDEIIDHVVAAIDGDYLKKSNMERLEDALGDWSTGSDLYDHFNAVTVKDQMKVDFMLEIFNDFTLEELETRLKK